MRAITQSILLNLFSSNACASVARMMFGYGIPIFMMHRMYDQNDLTLAESATSDTYLRQCLAYLADNQYTFLSLRELVQALVAKQSLPKKSIVFTMDDGFEDQARIATPIFREFDCPVTMFLITGMLDQQLWPWDDKVAHMINETQAETISIRIEDEHYQLSLNSKQEKRTARRTLQDAIKSAPFKDLHTILAQLEAATRVSISDTPPAKYKPLTWELVRQYERNGVEFSAHTISHPILSKLDSDSMKREILGSWQRVKEELTNPCPVFCYPTGRYCDYGWREIKFVRESGFIGGVSTIPAQVRPELMNQYYQYSLPRYALPKSFDEFRMYCSWIEFAKERNLHFWPR